MLNNLKTIEQTLNGKNIRTVWNREEEKYYISVVDIIEVLTESKDSQAYWRKLKQRLKNEGNETVTNCHSLRLKAKDGKLRMTDVVDIEGTFRLIESIPSKKAEPIKLWLARLGKERIDEEYDPEITINRAFEAYRRKGFSDELKNKGIKNGTDFATLTNLLTKIWSGYSVKEYKELKNLKKENLRDNMTNTELVLNMLAEVSSTEISKSKNETGYESAKDSVIKGGNIASIAKEQLEKETGKKIITNKNNKEIKKIA